jgi:membrane protein DedA with SNARE-associated domain
MFFSLPAAIQWLLHYKYFLFFPIVVVEGPIITIIAGFLSSLGQMNFYLAYLLAVAGDLTGDSLYYCLGRWGGNPYLARWIKYLGLTKERLAHLEGYFSHHAGKTLVLTKFTQGIGFAVLTAAGLAKVPYRKFLWYNLLPTIPKSFVLLLVGFYYGKAYLRINEYLNYTSFVIFSLVLFYLLVYFLGRKLLNRIFHFSVE